MMELELVSVSFNEHYAQNACLAFVFICYFCLLQGLLGFRARYLYIQMGDLTETPKKIDTVK